MNIDWSKAPEGFDVHIKWSRSDNFYRIEEDRYVRENGYYAKIEEAHQEALAITFRPFNGEGLPPVGLPVEWLECNQTGWQQVVVLAYADGDAWIKPQGKSSIIVGNPAGFRPIRTPEQIAAEEREKGIQNLLNTFPFVYQTEREIAEHIYDAGYRKQVTP